MNSNQNLSLIDNLNTMREEVFSQYYDNAVAKIHDQIRDNPFRTKFSIDCRFFGKDILEEVCRRFNAGGLTVSVIDRGSAPFSARFLEFVLPLPIDLYSSGGDNF